MYQLTNHDGVIKDGKFHIPKAPGNRYWRKYLAWLNEGNEPQPATPEPALPELIDAEL